MNHMLLIPFEISSQKVTAFPDQYTEYDTCFISMGQQTIFANLSNTLIYRQTFYRSNQNFFIIFK